ncbi:hypothetical protein B5S32_g1698 [[Candida] boidinii]|nr:hypothetical protein B5S32_g1698 [[Candida] boidinii]
MAKSYEISTNERDFILEALKQGLRLDSRKLLQMRELDIKLDEKEFGVVEISLGKTKLYIRVSSEIVQPYEDRPFEGIFQVSTEISPMAAPFFESGSTGLGKSQTDEEILISRLIEKAVRRSNALDLESLCIIAGSKVWSIRVDIQFLNYDGNFIDICCIGAMTALLHYKKPDCEVSSNDVIIYDTRQREPVPLSILHIPICITFNFFNPNINSSKKVTSSNSNNSTNNNNNNSNDNEEEEEEQMITSGATEENIKGDLNNEIILVDATLNEEQLSLGSMTLTLNKNKEICQISKSGGLPIDASLIMQCCNYASNIAEELTDKINSLIKEDLNKRKDSKMDKVLSATNDR